MMEGKTRNSVTCANISVAKYSFEVLVLYLSTSILLQTSTAPDEGHIVLFTLLQAKHNKLIMMGFQVCVLR